MPPKPRTAKPRPRKKATAVPTTGARDRMLLYGIVAAGAVAIAAVFAWIALAGGSDRMSAADARAAVDAAGCTLQSVKAQAGVHSVRTPEGKAKWNTSPPTNGPHYEIPAIWNAYTDPLNPAQVVHNLEHGGVFVLYGSRMPEATIAQLQSFYDKHRNGTLLAPLPALGDKIALGAWTTLGGSDAPDGTAYIAKCRSFDEAAFDAFFSAFQFLGPERFPPDSLLPGNT